MVGTLTLLVLKIAQIFNPLLSNTGNGIQYLVSI